MFHLQVLRKLEIEGLSPDFGPWVGNGLRSSASCQVGKPSPVHVSLLLGIFSCEYNDDSDTFLGLMRGECGLAVDGDKLGMESRRLVPAVQFGLWFFAFMLLESFVNRSVATLLGAQTVNAAYSLGIFCTATGLLAFGLAHAKREAWCERAVPIAAIACSMTSLGIAFAQHAALLAILSWTALLTCGFIGGHAHLEVAREFGESPLCGRVLGAATGTVVCVQFLVQNLAQGPGLELACIPASLVSLAVLHLRNTGTEPAPGSGSDANPNMQVRAWPQDLTDKQRHGLYLVIAAAILTVIFTLNDSIVVALDASGTIQLFSGVRLFYALGLVVAGLLYDLGPRFSFTFATVAAQMMAVLVPYFLQTPEWYTLNMTIFYFYGGFYVMFVTAEFVSFSTQMDRQALWAALGRTTRSYATTFAVIPVALLYDAFGVVALVVAGVILNMALLAVCVADTTLLARFRPPMLQEADPQSPAAASIKLSDEDVRHYARDLGLTDRESEVLALLVTTEDTNDKMANDLGISRRTLQRHIASVYNKADVQSRIGLYKALATHAANSD